MNMQIQLANFENYIKISIILPSIVSIVIFTNLIIYDERK